jgi:uncharacterized protein YybS (DUF2232 family)
MNLDQRRKLIDRALFAVLFAVLAAGVSSVALGVITLARLAF